MAQGHLVIDNMLTTVLPHVYTGVVVRVVNMCIHLSVENDVLLIVIANKLAIVVREFCDNTFACH